MIEITDKSFKPSEITRAIKSENSGAIVSFIGTVRKLSDDGKENNKDEKVKELIYECYKEMALEKIMQIREYALTNYHINQMYIIHRVGVLKPKDDIVMIAVSAAHRKDAFRACEYAIDELKRNVPIWKKEVTANNEYWVGENSP